MGTSLLKRKQAGQSIILIALVITVLFGMAGLSVDVGKAYAEQRAAQRAVNAATLKGIDSMIRNRTDETIYKDISDSLAANGIKLVTDGGTPGAGEYNFSAFYYDEKGTMLGKVGDKGKSQPEGNPTYINVELKGKSETYLARVMGVSTLDVQAEVYGMRSPACPGIYPYAVEAGTFDIDDGNSWLYSDDKYRNLTARRIYNKENSSLPGGFSWLRWKAATSSGSATQQIKDFTGEGTIEGFEEAPWQDNTAAGPEPKDYPYYPGQINNHDWVYGSSGNVSASGLKEQLDYHIKNRTEMRFPFFDVNNGQGANGVYHVSDIGRFLLLSYGKENGKDYLELAYVGPDRGCAALTDIPPATNDETLALEGRVLVQPRYISKVPDKRALDIVVVLDASYSMKWRWDKDTDGSTTPGRADTARYITMRELLKNFVSGSFLRPEDRLAIVTYEGNTGTKTYDQSKRYDQFSASSVDNAVGKNTKVLVDYTRTDTAGKQAIVTALNSYTYGGNTPSVVGMEAGRRLINAKGETSRTVVNNGVSTTMKVDQHLILMTDGVANTYIDGKFRNCDNGNSSSESCVGELAATNQPIDQVGDIAEDMKASFGSRLQMYVVALARDFDLRGLNRVPSNGVVYVANEATDMDGIFQSLQRDIEDNACNVVGENAQPPIDSSRLAEDGKIGQVTLYKDGQAVETVDIEDRGDGEAYYKFQNLAVGTYSLSGWVKYAGEDGVVRTYDLVSDGDAVAADKLAFQLYTSKTANRTVVGPTVYLSDDNDICATR